MTDKFQFEDKTETDLPGAQMPATLEIERDADGGIKIEVWEYTAGYGSIVLPAFAVAELKEWLSGAPDA